MAKQSYKEGKSNGSSGGGFKTCKGCPNPAQCKAVGKCLFPGDFGGKR